MISDSLYLYNSDDNKLVHIIHPQHLMFYAPYATDKDIGSPPARRGMPLILRPGQPDAYIVIPVIPEEHEAH